MQKPFPHDCLPRVGHPLGRQRVYRIRISRRDDRCVLSGGHNGKVLINADLAIQSTGLGRADTVSEPSTDVTVWPPPQICLASVKRMATRLGRPGRCRCPRRFAMRRWRSGDPVRYRLRPRRPPWTGLSPAYVSGSGWRVCEDLLKLKLP